MRPPIRIFVALCLFVSAVAVSSVVYAHADGLSPGQQEELVLQNIWLPAEVVPVYEPANPLDGQSPYCAPPALTDGVKPAVEPHCNSPGSTI